jgi:hypothetical protein
MEDTAISKCHTTRGTRAATEMIIKRYGQTGQMMHQLLILLSILHLMIALWLCKFGQMPVNVFYKSSYYIAEPFNNWRGSLPR